MVKPKNKHSLSHVRHDPAHCLANKRKPKSPKLSVNVRQQKNRQSNSKKKMNKKRLKNKEIL